MTFEETILTWLAEKQRRDVSLYSDLRVVAAYEGDYSDITLGAGQTCDLYFKYDGEDDGYYLSRDELSEFLNGIWEASKRD